MLISQKKWRRSNNNLYNSSKISNNKSIFVQTEPLLLLCNWYLYSKKYIFITACIQKKTSLFCFSFSSYVRGQKNKQHDFCRIRIQIRTLLKMEKRSKHKAHTRMFTIDHVDYSNELILSFFFQPLKTTVLGTISCYGPI